ncbi:MAG: hypothetical protein Kow0059_15710 [Candidatus Sumerlaeia bacterium]
MMLNCSGVRIFRHSSSLFSILSVAGAEALADLSAGSLGIVECPFSMEVGWSGVFDRTDWAERSGRPDAAD